MNNGTVLCLEKISSYYNFQRLDQYFSQKLLAKFPAEHQTFRSRTRISIDDGVV